MENERQDSLLFHFNELREERRRFENVFQSVTRMFEKYGVKETVVCGKTINDYPFFRQGKKHMIGLHNEINQLVSFVLDASEGGSSGEMAFVLVGEPGNGKTFFVNFICEGYRRFLSIKGNEKYSFEFVGMDKLGTYGKIVKISSQTYEDPAILAMNLFADKEKNKEFLSGKAGLKDAAIDVIYKNHRPLGACTAYIWEDIRKYCDGDIEKMLQFVKIFPVPLIENLGTVTGKYPAKDKITSSAVDLLGEESIPRLMHLQDLDNPFRFDLRRGALARVAGGGIHFADEIFKNKVDLVQVYLGVIQNRSIEMDGFKWPMDTLIIATSNNSEFNRFKAEKEQAPIIDRCRICYVSHNTDYKLQDELTKYAIGSDVKTVIGGGRLHQDPNLRYAANVAVVLTRLLASKKLERVETMKLAAGEIAGEKRVKVLAEVIDEANKNPDVTKRWGQKGMSQRNLGRAFQLILEGSTTVKGKCLVAYEVFDAMERIVLDYIEETSDKEKYIADIEEARKLYRERIMTEMFNAYMDEPMAIRKDVMNYVNMIIGTDADNLGPDNLWRYRDPQTGEMTAIRIDEKWVKSIEERLGVKNEEGRATFRTTIRKIYGQKISVDPNYDFMDNLDLVKAITDVRLKSDISGAGSLVGALANQTNDENVKLRARILKSMIEKLGYCKTCALKTIEHFCSTENES